VEKWGSKRISREEIAPGPDGSTQPQKTIHSHTVTQEVTVMNYLMIYMQKTLAYNFLTSNLRSSSRLTSGF